MLVSINFDSPQHGIQKKQTDCQTIDPEICSNFDFLEKLWE